MIQFSAADPTAVLHYLNDKLQLPAGVTLSDVTPAGDGNMNVTLKVTLSDGFPLILKQSRPFVAKFPDIPAPLDRINTEYRYLAAGMQDDQLYRCHPPVVHYDPDNYVLVLGYLDGARDMSYLYDDPNIDGDFLRQLGAYLTALHRLPLKNFPANRELRALNHAHIFDLPFRPDNGFPLDDIFPGLAEFARPYQEDENLRNTMAELGTIYLSDGPTLVHGDFYPGSFMLRGDQVFVIDGEFAHPGRAEFDLGVLLAHFDLAGIDGAPVLEHYEPSAGFDHRLVGRFRGAEIMRRLIGIAQLPLRLDLEARRELLEQGRRLVG